MSALRISCFGILLKHYLLRHHADAVAPKGRFSPAIEHAMSSVPVDFQIHADVPERTWDAAMTEEYLQVHICLRLPDAPLGGVIHLSVQGILSRGRQEQAVNTLMPGRLTLADSTGLHLGAFQIQTALGLLAQPVIPAVVVSESRIGIFQAIHQPTLFKTARQPHAEIKLARVA